MARVQGPADVARGLAPWVVAAALHLVATLAIYAAERPPAPPVAADEAAGAPAEIDVTYDVAAAAPAVDSAPHEGSRAALRDAPRTLEAANEPRASKVPQDPDAPRSNEVLTGDPNGAATWTFRSTAGGGTDVRLGTLGAMAVAGEQHETPPQRAAPRGPVSKTGGLAEALTAGDVARGLGHAGPVRRAIDEAARTENAPTFGTATFAVTLGEGGAVGVALLRASSEQPGWDALRPLIRDAVAAAPQRIAVHGTVRVVVQVEASEQFPGGGKPTPDAQQGTKLSGSLGALQESKDHLEVVPPHVALTYRTRNCAAGVVVVPGSVNIAAGCEPGVAMRVVSTKIMSETPL